jgi:transposase
MWKTRTTKTASGKTAIQVVQRAHQKTKIIKHIGSGKTKSEIADLQQLASEYIRLHSPFQSLFSDLLGPVLQTQSRLISADHLVVKRTSRQFSYEILSFFYAYNGFSQLHNALLEDLAIIRIIEPASKIRSLILLKRYFGKTYGHDRLYDGLKELTTQKERIEQIALSFAKQRLYFDCSLVFYDVTTLYFETFKSDEDITDEKRRVIAKGFRKKGFSKDNKPNQPQIMIGLVVTKEGYPIAIDWFCGNTFEGHTMVPVILALKKKHQIEILTVIADAAMLSIDNMKELKEHELKYIVGARIKNLSPTTREAIAAKLNKTENIYYKEKTDSGALLCAYSHKRAAKDKLDRENQIKKAQKQLKDGKIPVRATRFLRTTKETVWELNQELIEKDKLLDGIKGYYTNVDLPEQLIINRYKDLWHVEKAFRITKSDLEARPVFHHKQKTIEAHMLIVFVSLCVAKSIELLTHVSIKKVVDGILQIEDITFEDTLTKTEFTKRMDISTNQIAQIVEKLQKNEKKS